MLPLLAVAAACGPEGSVKRTDARQDRGTDTAADTGGPEPDAGDDGGGGEDAPADTETDAPEQMDAADAGVDAPADMAMDAGVDRPPTVVNLAGNPGVELPANGTVAVGGDYTWLPFNPGVATFAQSTAQAHGGASSALLTGRQSVQGGVGYVTPAGAGTYQISIWTMHTDAVSHLLGLTWRRCSPSDFQLIASPLVPIPPNTWSQLTATITVPDNCIHSTVYIEQNETMDGGPGVVADIYADDISIVPLAVPNVVGNGGGEVAISTSSTSPWKGSGCTVAQSTAVFHTGAGSVTCAGRAAANSGPAYYLPAGAATYTIFSYVQHTGTVPIDLALTATLVCAQTANGALSTTVATVASAMNATPSTWTPLAGTLTIPPFCTTAFLRVEQTAGAQIPDLFVDDLSAALAP